MDEEHWHEIVAPANLVFKRIPTIEPPSKGFDNDYMMISQILLIYAICVYIGVVSGVNVPCFILGVLGYVCKDS